MYKIYFNWICLRSFQQPFAFIDKLPLPQPSLLSHQHPTATVRTLVITVNCLVWSIFIENRIVQIRTTKSSTSCNVNPFFHDIKLWIKDYQPTFTVGPLVYEIVEFQLFLNCRIWFRSPRWEAPHYTLSQLWHPVHFASARLYMKTTGHEPFSVCEVWLTTTPRPNKCWIQVCSCKKLGGDSK